MTLDQPLERLSWKSKIHPHDKRSLTFWKCFENCIKYDPFIKSFHSFRAEICVLFIWDSRRIRMQTNKPVVHQIMKLSVIDIWMISNMENVNNLNRINLSSVELIFPFSHSYFCQWERGEGKFILLGRIIEVYRIQYVGWIPFPSTVNDLI